MRNDEICLACGGELKEGDYSYGKCKSCREKGVPSNPKILKSQEKEGLSRYKQINKNEFKNDLKITITILIFMYLFDLLQMYMFRSGYYAIDNFAGAFGALTVDAAIPLVLALIFKHVLNFSFFGTFWKSLIFIGIPLSLLSFHGGCLRHKKEITSINYYTNVCICQLEAQNKEMLLDVKLKGIMNHEI